MWATCKRLKNVVQLSLLGLSIAAAYLADNPTGWIFALRLGIEKADHDPSKISLEDKVRYHCYYQNAPSPYTPPPRFPSPRLSVLDFCRAHASQSLG
jgi:hypothetical protein